jgi:hypothetical protein
MAAVAVARYELHGWQLPCAQRAREDRRKPDRRFCTVYVPTGIVMEQWTPAATGSAFEFTPILKPLARLEPFRNQLLVLSGLDNTGAISLTGESGAHAQPAGAFLTGVEALRTTGSSSLQLGVSMDQIAAKVLRQQTGATYPQIGVSDAHHSISHHGGDKQKILSLTKINTCHTTPVAHFLDKLRSTSDSDGTLLDNVMILYGSAISDGNRHDIRSLPILLAGGGVGRIRGGRHISYPKGTERLTNLQVTLLNKLGVPTERFGDSAGELRELSDLSGTTA